MVYDKLTKKLGKEYLKSESITKFRRITKITAEGVDLDISIAIDKLALTPHQQSLNYLCNHEPIILKAIRAIKN